MRQGLQTLSTDRKQDPQVVVEGMEDVLEMDLKKNEGILAQTQTELSEYQSARIHEKNRKKHYEGLIGGGKFNDGALKRGIDQSVINIKHFSDKIKLSNDKIVLHTDIVKQLKDAFRNQYAGLKVLEEHKRNGSAN